MFIPACYIQVDGSWLSGTAYKAFAAQGADTGKVHIGIAGDEESLTVYVNDEEQTDFLLATDPNSFSVDIQGVTLSRNEDKTEITAVFLGGKLYYNLPIPHFYFAQSPCPLA